MESVLRAIAVYVFLLLVFRIAGKRSLAETTTFDLVLLLIFSEALQQAMLDDDNSLTNGFLVIVTLIGIDILLSVLKQRSPGLDRWLDDVPLVVVEDGKPLKDRMAKARIDESDVLTAARLLQGLERMDQIKYAVLERSGGISIIPKQASQAS